MKPLQELKREFKEAKAELKLLEAERDKRVASIKQQSAYKKIEEELRVLEGEWSELSKKYDKIHDKSRQLFHSDWNPTYSRSGDFGSYSNIYSYVIDAIKKHLKISYLRGSDVEVLVKALVKEEEKKQGLPPILVRLDELRDNRTKLKDQRSIFEGETRWYKSDERGKLGNRVQHLKYVIACPEKAMKEEEMFNKREAERAKIKNPKVIQAIYKDVMKDEK